MTSGDTAGVRRVASLLLLALVAVPPAASAKSLCAKKKTECKDAAGLVKGCCSSSQVCKAGTCYYPGELQLMEEKKKSTPPPPPPPQAQAALPLPAAGAVDGDERIAMLAALLEKNTDFKVRVQAALSLGKIKDPKTVPPLAKALGDKHPAVRAAAATALGKSGEPAALAALGKAKGKDASDMVNEAVVEAITALKEELKKQEELEKVPDQVCPGPPAKVKYLFIVDTMTNGAGGKPGDLSKIFKKQMAGHLTMINDAMILTKKEVPQEMLDKVAKGKMRAFILSAILKNLEEKWDGASSFMVTANVSVICSHFPSQSLAMTMQATASSSLPKSAFRQKLVPKMRAEAIGGTLVTMTKSLKENIKKLLVAGG